VVVAAEALVIVAGPAPAPESESEPELEKAVQDLTPKFGLDTQVVLASDSHTEYGPVSESGIEVECGPGHCTSGCRPTLDTDYRLEPALLLPVAGQV